MGSGPAGPAQGARVSESGGPLNSLGVTVTTAASESKFRLVLPAPAGGPGHLALATSGSLLEGTKGPGPRRACARAGALGAPGWRAATAAVPLCRDKFFLKAITKARRRGPQAAAHRLSGSDPSPGGPGAACAGASRRQIQLSGR